MIRIVVTLPLCAGLALPATAGVLQEPVEATAASAAEGDPEEEYQELVDAFDEAMNEFSEAYQAAETEEARQALFESSYPDPADYTAGFWKYADKYAGTEHAPNALTWIVERAQGEDKQRALDRLLSDHLDSPQLSRVCQAMLYDIDVEVTEALRTVFAKSPHHEVRGQACFTIACHLKGQAAVAESAEDRELLIGESIELFEQVWNDFADLPHWRGNLAKAADGQLFELRNLQIGMPAPDIEGEDLDGVEFKLSDYRGKVVVLDFWGHW